MYACETSAARVCGPDLDDWNETASALRRGWQTVMFLRLSARAGVLIASGFDLSTRQDGGLNTSRRARDGQYAKLRGVHFAQQSRVFEAWVKPNSLAK